MDDNEAKEVLYRLDERTEMIQQDIQDVKEINKSQREDIVSNRELASKNRQILNLITLGLGGLSSALMAKILGIIKFLN